MARILYLDTTLRDGAQTEGVSFSVSDKLNIARALDRFGIDYIEGGFPGANPKDEEFFRQAENITWQNAKLTAFGATRYKGSTCEHDPAVQAVARSKAPACAIVAKSSLFQVEEILETTPREGLAMISDTVAYLVAAGKEVILDAEHFFDGYKQDRDFALAALRAAQDAGASWLALCDTNGGSLPQEAAEITARVVADLESPVAIHAHNDLEMGVAVSVAAVAAGATQVHGTINGIGERTGNANLCSVIPTLALKMDYSSGVDGNLGRLTELSHLASELANLTPNQHQPFVSNSAFAHKAGYHASASSKFEHAYQHIDPALVGNRQRILISELSGSKNIASTARRLGISQTAKSAAETLEAVKLLEAEGYHFEGAEASFELLLLRHQPGYQAPFELIDFLALTETRGSQPVVSEAVVKLQVNGDQSHTAADGNGPVSALDGAFRKAILPAYPELAKVQLIDYKVRILDPDSGTGAFTRVLITMSDGEREWSTVGSSANIVEASWVALIDGYEYSLRKGLVD